MATVELSRQTACPFGPARASAHQCLSPWDQPQAANPLRPTRWQTAPNTSANTQTLWGDSPPQRQSTRATWAQIHPASPANHRRATQTPWSQASAQRGQARTLWAQPAAPLGAHTTALWAWAVPHRAHLLAPWQSAQTLAQHARAPWHPRAALRHSAPVFPWQIAQTLSVWQSGPVFVRPAQSAPGQGTTTAPPIALCAPAHQSGPHAVLIHLGFDHCAIPPDTPSALLLIPAASYYMAVHTLTLHLMHPNALADISQATELPITNASLSADVASTGWSLNASGPASLFDALAPGASATGAPTLRTVRLTLDGLAFTFVVDSLRRTEQFGQRGTALSARSPSALLAAPYALASTRLNTQPATAQQLAQQALDGTGFTLNWGLDDWLIPAGAWSHQGTPLEAVQQIAAAAGGHVLSHRAANTLLVRHPYPTLTGGLPGGPWNWAAASVTPDAALSPDALITIATERKDNAAINGVWVSGTTQGITRLVKRTGSAGDQLAPQQTDPLITDAPAAQQRGLSILGAAGAKHLVQIDLPILVGATAAPITQAQAGPAAATPSHPGLLEVGQLVQINDATPWRARVRAVAANATFGQSARQTVSLERHLP